MSQGWNLCRLHRLLCMSLALSRPYNHVSVSAVPVTNIVSLITFFLVKWHKEIIISLCREMEDCFVCLAAIDLNYVSFHKSPRGPGLRTATAAGLPRPGSLANGFGDPAISRGRARAASVTKMSSTCPDMLPDRTGLKNTCEKTLFFLVKQEGSLND